jgi:hypothetical protein
MSTIRKEIYNTFELRLIYLPEKVLDEVESEIRKRINEGESLFQLLYELERTSKYNKYNKKSDGQYSNVAPLDKIRRAIIMIDENGKETYFDSVYGAVVKGLGLTKNAVGNVTKAANKKTKSYGRTWKWVL